MNEETIYRGKSMRYSDIFNNYLRLHIVLRLFVIILIVFFVFGTSIHLIEPEQFPTIFDGVWWVIVTASTVGYGDFVPTTTTGRFIAMLLILVGAGFVTFYMATVASFAIQTQNAVNEGRAVYRNDGHLVVIGWNERARNTINQLTRIDDHFKIVLIDHTLMYNPVKLPNVHYINGDATDDETLMKANIKEAKLILITADQHNTETDADMRTILSLLAVKGLNPDIYSVAELLTPHQVNNAKRAGADEIIETTTITGNVMTNTLISQGITDPLSALLDYLTGDKLTYLSLTEDEIGLSYCKIVQFFIEKEVLVIGIKKGGKTFVNPPLETKVEHGDQLLVIKH